MARHGTGPAVRSALTGWPVPARHRAASARAGPAGPAFAAGLLGGLLQDAAGLLRRASARTVLTAQDLAMGGTALLGAAAPGFGAFGSARIL